MGCQNREPLLRRKLAAAGRSKVKLDQAVNEFGTPEIAIIDGVDVTNINSLIDLAKRTSMLLNCVGPYRKYGEAVIRACISESTDYFDVCGEPGAVFQFSQCQWQCHTIRHVYC
jgi:short subunit dehydrogenase-like uncharacterized protein